jgi:exonuclease III
MKIATFNINGINRRLGSLLEWPHCTARYLRQAGVEE